MISARTNTSTVNLLGAGTSLAGPTDTDVKAQLVSEKLICRAPVNNGLLITRAKQCYTQAEWEARQRRMQQSMRDVQMRNLLQQN